MSLLAAALIAAAGVIAAITFDTAATRIRHLDGVLADASVYDDPSKASGLEGRIVVATGTAASAEELRDTAFNLSVPAIKLMRESQIYQWSQSGAKVKTYRKDWHPDPVDSEFFDWMHQNAGRVSYPTEVTTADEVDLMQSGRKLARLDPSFTQFLGGQMKLMLSREQYHAMPADVRMRFDLVDGSLVEKTAAAGDPRIGDNRTRFLMVPPYEVTVVGMLAGGRIMMVDRKLRPVGILKPGRLSVEAMRMQMQDEIIRDGIFPGLLALAIWTIGLLMFRSDFRHAPRVVRPVEPIRLGR